MKITTIIVSFNAAKYIDDAIKSFLAQDYENKELICFDGISTDKTHDIINQYVAKHPDIIKFINHEKDSGISDARNKALKYATGDYIGFLGADDRLCEGIFTKMYEYKTKIARLESLDLFYFDSYINIVNMQNMTTTKIRTCNNVKTSNLYFSLRQMITHIPMAPGEAFYYNKEIFKELTFNVNNKYSMDYEFNLNLLAIKRHITSIAIDYPGVIMHYSNETTSGNNTKKQYINALLIAAKFSIMAKKPHFLVIIAMKIIYFIARNLFKFK